MSIKKAKVCLVFAALCWGMAGICVKSVVWGSMTLMAVRSVISLIMLFALKGSFKLKFTKNNVIGSLFNTATGILYILSIKLTTAGTAIVLQYMAPILVFLFAVIFQKKKARPYEYVFTALVFFGIFLSFADSLDSSRVLGNILGLLSGFTFAGQIITMNREDVDSEDSLIISNLLSFIITVPFVFFDKNIVLDAKNIIWALVLGIVQYGMANILFSKGIKVVDKVEASLILTIEPIFNPIPVAIFCNEMMGVKAIIGFIIVIVFVTLYGVMSDRKQKSLPEPA